MLILAPPYAQNLHVVVKLQPEMSVGHSQLRWNKINRNVPRRSAVYMTISGQHGNAQLSRKKTREYLGGNSLQPFLRIFGFGLLAHGCDVAERCCSVARRRWPSRCKQRQHRRV